MTIDSSRDAGTAPPGAPRTPATLTLRRVWSTWWPLGSSWILMGLELPLVSAVMARLANPEINLAAYSGIVFAIALLVEAPVIMLLAASTTLSRDWESYVSLRRFTLGLGLSMTAVHALVAFTPLYDFVVNQLIGAPAVIVEPGRLGLRLVTPWTFMIAIRRFQQGVLIRGGRSRSVGLGTLLRLMTYLVVLACGSAWTDLPGAALAATGAALAVTVEALVVKLRVEPLLREMKKRVGTSPDHPETALSFRRLTAFYVPLAVTPMMTLIGLPLVSAALSRMPLAIESLAVWPVLSGLTFALRSFGIAFNEVVLALVDEPGAGPVLRRFAGLLAASTTLFLLLFVSTPIATLWFGGVTGLAPDLVALARAAMWIVVAFPAVSVYQSYKQARIVNSHRTRGVTEAVALQLVTSTAILASGVLNGGIIGLFVGITANFAGNVAQLLWLRHRERGIPALASDLAPVGEPAASG